MTYEKIICSNQLTDSTSCAASRVSGEHDSATPIIKWVGGKTQLLEKLTALIPENFSGTYYEPFLGGAAMYLALDVKKAVLNDFNPQLINLYSQCKDQPETLKSRLKELEASHDGTKEFYFARRSDFNACLAKNETSLESAALMLYLNKTCFNGLYRLNKKGQFNSAFGQKKTVTLFDEGNFDKVSEKMKSATLLTGDFEKACEDCQKGDLVFFDSPYYNTFDTYQKDGFSETDHRRLKALFDKLTRKGVYCILTNSNEDFIKNLYKDYNIEVVDVERKINCNASNRTGQEVIITNYDPETSEIVSVYSINEKKGLEKMEKTNINFESIEEVKELVSSNGNAKELYNTCSKYAFAIMELEEKKKAYGASLYTYSQFLLELEIANLTQEYNSRMAEFVSNLDEANKLYYSFCVLIRNNEFGAEKIGMELLQQIEKEALAHGFEAFAVFGNPKGQTHPENNCQMVLNSIQKLVSECGKEVNG